MERRDGSATVNWGLLVVVGLCVEAWAGIVAVVLELN
jgi:hypothetical protein